MFELSLSTRRFKASRNCRTRWALVASLVVGVSWTSPARALDVLVSADGEGRLEPCAECSERAGGIARRASVVRTLREETGDLLLVDAGNFLIGGDSRASGGRIIVEAYSALAYDAVNVSFRDFRLGKAATLEVLKEAGFPPISANLLDAESGERLFQPYVVKKVGDQRVAVIGLTETPPGLDRVPHLVSQLAGVRIAPAAAALRAVLAEVESEADVFVLLYYGSAGSLAADVRGLEERFAVIAIGGAEFESLPPALAGRCVKAREQGRGLGRATRGAGGDSALRVAAVDVPEETPRDSLLAKIVAEEYRRQAEELEKAKAEAQLVTSLPAKPRANEAYQFALQAENRGMSLAVKSVIFPYSFGGVGQAGNTELMVVDLSFGSNVAMDLVLEQDYPEQVRVASLRRQLFAVVNGKWIGTVAARAADMFGHLPDGFRVRDPGRPVVGAVAFDLPQYEEIRSLELRFYHDQYSPLVLPLRPAAEPGDEVPGDSGSSVSAAGENADVRLAVAAFDEPERLSGKPAPQGRKLLSVDLLGRSRMATQTDALALDETGEPDRKVTQPKVMEYQYAQDFMHLLGEGHVAVGFDPLLSRVPDPLYFLPDVEAGYRLGFSLPASRSENLRLRCFFPEMKLSDQKAFRQPQPIDLPLKGSLVEPELAPAITVIRDTPVQVGVMSVDVVAEIGVYKPSKKSRFVRLEIKIVNTGQQSGMLTIRDRFRLGWDDRRPAPYSARFAAATDAPPLDPLYMHVGEQRSFRVAWNVPEDVDQCFLDYKGIALSTRVPLSLGGTAGGEQEATEQNAREPFDSPTVEAKPLVYELKPVGLEGFGVRGADVNRAIDRGRDFLWELLQTEDDVGGRRVLGWRKEHPLAALALVHTGAHRKYPALDAALRRMFVEAKPTGTYAVGFYCMLLDAYGDPAFYDRLRLCAQALVDNQGPRGTWGYRTDPEYPEEAPPKTGGDAAESRGGLVVEGGEAIVDDSEQDARREPIERTTDWESGDDGDYSTTQFAVLGLRAAERRGFRLPRRTWERVRSGFVAGEGRTGGGWGYTYSNRAAYGSMTCAGLASLAIARHALEEEAPLESPAIFRGERWLDDNFSAATNPVKGDYFYYYIYSVERIGQLLDSDFIGRHEWYPMGAKVLVQKQQDDGSWIGGRHEKDPRVATSFALLFLTRATEKLDPEPPPKPTGPGTLITAYKAPPPRDLYVILDGSGSMLAKIGGKRKFDIARDAVAGLIQSVPDETNVALRVYGHRKFAINAGADEDTALEIPLRKLNRAAFLAKLKSLRPRGKTPLALSLEQAAKDLRSTRSPVAVLLLTDGGEDTRARRDPIKAAATLARKDEIELRIVGFDINRAAWTRQLEAMAKAGGGEYWPIASADRLASQVGAVVSGSPPAFAVVAADGKELASGVFGESVELPPGRHVLRIEVAGRTVERAIGINAAGTTRVTLDPSDL